MWCRKKVGLICAFALVLSCGIAFSQSDPVIQKGEFLSIDSLRAKTSEVMLKFSPIAVEQEELSTGQGGALSGPSQPPVTSESSSESQWVSFRFTYTKWSWEIRKPGTYAGKVVEGFIESNSVLLVDFGGFGNLGLQSIPYHSADNYYAVSHPSARIEDLNWMTASELNAFIIRLDETFPASSYWALWHRVEVVESSPAQEIEAGATISIKLQNTFPFVEPTPGLK
jgi:hypothetical protein